MQKVKSNDYVQLFLTFFKLGLFTIGGGMAMIPLIQEIVVDKKKWMTEEETVDCIAVSQGLPGVIAINMATYIGQARKGIAGAVVATCGVMMPSLIIIIAVIKVLNGIGPNPYVDGALTGIKAAATGLIAFSAYKLGKQVLTGYFQWALAVISFLVLVFLNVNAVWVILCGIALGLIYTHFKGKTEDGGESE